MTGCIAVLNAGSSSIKFALYEAGRDGALLFRGQVEGIGVAPRLKVADAAGETVAERSWPAGELDHRGATREILQLGRELLAGRPRAGVRPSRRARRHANSPRRCGSTPTSGRARQAGAAGAAASAAQSRAHRGDRRRGARTCRRSPASTRPSIARQPPLAQAFALPRELTDAGVRRYGFHGLSYEFIVARLREIAPELARSRAGHRPSRQRRQPVRRARRPQRRQHHGLHRRRRADDGHALRRARSRRAALPDAGARAWTPRRSRT